MERRAFLATVATIGVGGCLSRADTGPADEESPDLEVQEEAIVDEDMLIEVRTMFHEHDELRYVDGDSVETLVPDREQWVQGRALIDYLGDEESDREEFELPEPTAIEAVVVETGERLEPLLFPIDGVGRDAIEKHIYRQRVDDRWRTAELGPLFDAPDAELALDVAPILGRDEPVLLNGGF